MITLKGNSYTIKTLPFDMGMCLEKNGKAIVLIPEEYLEDFIQILSSAGACEKFLNSNTNKTNENEKETKN